MCLLSLFVIPFIMSEEVRNELCFALVESPANGVVCKTTPPAARVVAVIQKWLDSGGGRALEAANSDAALDRRYWVTMPQTILADFEVDLGGDLGAARIVAMHLVRGSAHT